MPTAANRERRSGSRDRRDTGRYPDRRDSRPRDEGRDDYYTEDSYYGYSGETYESRSRGYRPRESEYTYGYESQPRGYRPPESEYTYAESRSTYESRGRYRDERDRQYADRGRYGVYRSRRRSPSQSSYTDSTVSGRPLVVVKKVQKVAHIQQPPPVVNLPPPVLVVPTVPPPDPVKWEPNLSILGSDAEPAVLDAFRATVTKAVTKYLQEDDVSAYVKVEMDRQFGRPWCCIYGGHFDSFITHDEGMFVYFKLQGKYGLVWRNRNK